MKKRISILTILLFLFLLSLQAFAQDTPFLHCAVNNQPIAGVEFHLFAVAEWNEPTQSFIPYARFENYPVSLKVKASAEYHNIALTYQGFIIQDGLEPDYVLVSDSNGDAYLPYNAKKNCLYMIQSTKIMYQEKTYFANAFMSAVLEKAGSIKDYHYETADIKVSKAHDESEGLTGKIIIIWEGETDSSRNSSIQYHLYNESSLYQTDTIHQNEGWSKSYQVRNTKSIHSIAEQIVPGYSIRVAQNGYDFIITYTKIQANEQTDTTTHQGEKDDILPVTGLPWSRVLITALLGLLLITTGLILNKGRKRK